MKELENEVSESFTVICDKLGEMEESSVTQKWEKIALTLQRDTFWKMKTRVFNTDSQKKTIPYSVARNSRTLENNRVIIRCHEGKLGHLKFHFSFVNMWPSSFTWRTCDNVWITT